MAVLLSVLSFAPCKARANAAPVVSALHDPFYAGLHDQIQALVNICGLHDMNYFCVIAYGPQSEGDTESLPLIYWVTQDKLIVWGVGGDRLFESDRYIDLSRNILPEGQSTTSPDYLTKSGAEMVLEDCQRRGERFTARKTQGGWVSIDKFDQFSTAQAQLPDFVDHNGKVKQNRFCIIGQKDGAFLGAYVIWLNAGQLFFWLPSPYDKVDTNVLTDAALQIDLRAGLRDKEDSKDDRDEMQRSYAEGVLRACHESGLYFYFQKTN